MKAMPDPTVLVDVVFEAYEQEIQALRAECKRLNDEIADWDDAFCELITCYQNEPASAENLEWLETLRSKDRTDK